MPPVLLIPGNMCDEQLWQPVAERLAEAGHLVGHAPRLNQISIAAMADSIEAAIGRPVVAIGFSMGAIVAAEFRSRGDRSVRHGGARGRVASGPAERPRARPTGFET